MYSGAVWNGDWEVFVAEEMESEDWEEVRLWVLLPDTVWPREVVVFMYGAKVVLTKIVEVGGKPLRVRVGVDELDEAADSVNETMLVEPLIK